MGLQGGPDPQGHLSLLLASLGFPAGGRLQPPVWGGGLETPFLRTPPHLLPSQ